MLVSGDDGLGYGGNSTLWSLPLGGGGTISNESSDSDAEGVSGGDTRPVVNSFSDWSRYSVAGAVALTGECSIIDIEEDDWAKVDDDDAAIASWNDGGG